MPLDPFDRDTSFTDNVPFTLVFTLESLSVVFRHNSEIIFEECTEFPWTLTRIKGKCLETAALSREVRSRGKGYNGRARSRRSLFVVAKSIGDIMWM